MEARPKASRWGDEELEAPTRPGSPVVVKEPMSTLPLRPRLRRSDAFRIHSRSNPFASMLQAEPARTAADASSPNHSSRQAALPSIPIPELDVYHALPNTNTDINTTTTTAAATSQDLLDDPIPQNTKPLPLNPLRCHPPPSLAPSQPVPSDLNPLPSAQSKSISHTARAQHHLHRARTKLLSHMSRHIYSICHLPPTTKSKNLVYTHEALSRRVLSPDTGALIPVPGHVKFKLDSPEDLSEELRRRTVSYTEDVEGRKMQRETVGRVRQRKTEKLSKALEMVRSLMRWRYEVAVEKQEGAETQEDVWRRVAERENQVREARKRRRAGQKKRGMVREDVHEKVAEAERQRRQVRELEDALREFLIGAEDKPAEHEHEHEKEHEVSDIRVRSADTSDEAEDEVNSIDEYSEDIMLHLSRNDEEANTDIEADDTPVRNQPPPQVQPPSSAPSAAGLGISNLDHAVTTTTKTPRSGRDRNIYSITTDAQEEEPRGRSRSSPSRQPAPTNDDPDKPRRSRARRTRSHGRPLSTSSTIHTASGKRHWQSISSYWRRKAAEQSLPAGSAERSRVDEAGNGLGDGENHDGDGDETEVSSAKHYHRMLADMMGDKK